MLYFTRQELSYTYGVSVKTAQNWVRAAKEGRMKLDLIEDGRYTYVARTPGNIATLDKLAGERKKYRPHNTSEVVKPRPEFYNHYTEPQVYDIMTNLELHHELPRQYNYFDVGAQRWDDYTHRLAAQDSYNTITTSQKLLVAIEDYLDILLEKYKRVNVIDIGVGNALPARELLAHLLKQGKLGRYIAIDISEGMLRIAKRNVNEWFKGKVRFEGYEIDITREHFSNLVAEDYIKDENEETVNLVLLLGGTLYNLRDPDSGYRVIRESMGVRDILIHTQGLDSITSRRYFDFNTQPSKPILPPIHGFVVDMLNIEPSAYKLELGYDEDTRQRFERIRFEMPLAIEFDFSLGKRRITFDKGDTILVWRFWQQTFSEVVKQFDHNGFHLLSTMQTPNRIGLLTISQLK